MNPASPATENERPSKDGVLSILFASAVEAAIRACVVLLLGGLALGLVGGIFHKMLPEPPPGFSATTAAESTSMAMTLMDSTRLALGRHKFLLLFLLLFGISMWTRVGPANGAPGSHSRKVLGRISEDWFGLLVGNALGAIIAAYMLVWAGFSLEKWLLSGVVEWCFTRLHDCIQAVFGQAPGNAFQQWQHWFLLNQFRFTFWCLFIASVCDDLGLPNLKTLGKRLWRGLRTRTEGPPGAT
jgi:hypothetical protein